MKLVYYDLWWSVGSPMWKESLGSPGKPISVSLIVLEKSIEGETYYYGSERDF